jgi:hypothetical protein
MSTDAKYDQVKKFVTDGGMDMVENLETGFNCASACDVPLFYVTRSIFDGRPMQECVQPMVDSIKQYALPAGIIAIITGGMLLFAMVGACPLCTGKPDEDK